MQFACIYKTRSAGVVRAITELKREEKTGDR
jgi:hypothetical protein